MMRGVFIIVLGGVCAQQTFVPNPSEPVMVPCTDKKKHACNNGFCLYDNWQYNTDTDPWTETMLGVCYCHHRWATLNYTQPCSYKRHSKQNALLLQIFLGPLAVAPAVLGWETAVMFHWGIVAYGCCAYYMSRKFEQWNVHVTGNVASVLAACLSYASFITVTFFYVLLCFMIGGSHCVDSNGVYCS